MVIWQLEGLQEDCVCWLAIVLIHFYIDEPFKKHELHWLLRQKEACLRASQKITRLIFECSHYSARNNCLEHNTILPIARLQIHFNKQYIQYSSASENERLGQIWKKKDKEKRRFYFRCFWWKKETRFLTSLSGWNCKSSHVFGDQPPKYLFAHREELLFECARNGCTPSNAKQPIIWLSLTSVCS